jgi:hypothetical protein
MDLSVDLQQGIPISIDRTTCAGKSEREWRSGFREEPLMGLALTARLAAVGQPGKIRAILRMGDASRLVRIVLSGDFLHSDSVTDKATTHRASRRRINIQYPPLLSSRP